MIGFVSTVLNKEFLLYHYEKIVKSSFWSKVQIQLIFCDIRKTSALLEIQNSFFASNSLSLVGRMGAKKYTAFQQSFMIFFPLFLRLTGHFVNDSYVKMWSFVLHIICKEKRYYDDCFCRHV